MYCTVVSMFTLLLCKVKILKRMKKNTGLVQFFGKWNVTDKARIEDSQTLRIQRAISNNLLLT